MSDGTGDGGGGAGEAGGQLERRYRKLLRVLPKPYREARGEELLSALMDGSAKGRTRPELREALSLARLGFRVWMGREAGGVRVDTRIGATARVVAIAGSILLAFTGATQLAVIIETFVMNPAYHWDWAHPVTASILRIGTTGTFSLAYVEVPALWLVVLALIAIGWWRTARGVAVVVFLLSVYLTDGTYTAMEEQTVLAAVVTAALFAVRGVDARPARVAGLAGLAAAIAGSALVLGALGEVGGTIPPAVIRCLLALQAWSLPRDHGVLVVAGFAAAVACAAAYRSVVWPVALATVSVAALVPVMARVAVHPVLGGGQLYLLAFPSCTLVAVAGLAVVRDRRVGRRERSASAG